MAQKYNINKWEDFKHRRTQVVDRYLRVSRKMLVVKRVISVMAVQKVMNHFNQNVKTIHRMRTRN